MKICTSIHNTKAEAEQALRRLDLRWKAEIAERDGRWLVICPQLADLLPHAERPDVL